MVDAKEPVTWTGGALVVELGAMEELELEVEVDVELELVVDAAGGGTIVEVTGGGVTTGAWLVTLTSTTGAGAVEVSTITALEVTGGGSSTTTEVEGAATSDCGCEALQKSRKGSN